MTSAQAFLKAVDDLERLATGKEKFELMHSKGHAKAKLLKKLLNLYAIPWDASWFTERAAVKRRTRKAGAA